MEELYFGYGSNLDLEDWAMFCRAYGHDPDVLRPLGPAHLPDEMLVFYYRSTRRQCGALNIRPAVGQRVDGYLFAIHRNVWAALDHEEGHPRRYRREGVTVIDARGRGCDAQTYRVTPEHRSGFTPPSENYLAVCRAGRACHGLSNAQLDRAAAGPEV